MFLAAIPNSPTEVVLDVDRCGEAVNLLWLSLRHYTASTRGSKAQGLTGQLEESVVIDACAQLEEGDDLCTFHFPDDFPLLFVCKALSSMAF